jgi:hypothetical protein
MMNKRLLCEGPDDKHVIGNLLFNHGLDGVFHVKEKDGIENLLDTLSEELEATDADRFGVIVDADLDIARRWSQVRTILLGAGYRERVQLLHSTELRGFCIGKAIMCRFS